MPIQVGQQEALERGRLQAHRGAEQHQGRQLPRLVRRARTSEPDRLACSRNDVIDLGTEHATDGFVQHAAAGQGRVLAQHLGAVRLEQFDLVQLLQRQQAGANAVVDVVRVVGDLVGEVAQLRFQGRLGMVQKTMRHAAGIDRLDLAGVDGRTVLEDALTRLEAQVETVPGRVALLQMVHHAQALQVVLEAAPFAARPAHAVVERILPSMAEGGVAEVVRQRDGLDQVFIEGQRAGNRAAELRHFQRMGQAGAEQVALVIEEDLRLVDQAAKRGGVNDAVTVALERRAGRRGCFGMAATAGLGRIRRVGGQNHANRNVYSPIPASNGR